MTFANKYLNIVADKEKYCIFNEKLMMYKLSYVQCGDRAG
jgi:hypothetical protein